MKATQFPILTIGHSNHSPTEFIALLKQHGVDEIVDVRSAPYSRYASQFNHNPLENVLEAAGMGYMFLGAELGGRPSDRSYYDTSGRVLYERLANTDMFDDGVAYLLRNADERRIALMCTEKDPLDCHRSLLVARVLVERGAEVYHILSDGSLEDHNSTMERLVGALKLPPNGDLFRSKADVLADALMIQEKKVAYVTNSPQNTETEQWDGF